MKTLRAFLFFVLTGVAFAQCPAGQQVDTRFNVRLSDTNVVQNVCVNLSTGALTFLAPTLASATGSNIVPITNITTLSPTDGYVFIVASNCTASATTTAFTSGPSMIRAAANNPVLSMTTNTTAGTINLTCDLSDLSWTRLTANKGVTVNDVSLLYGVQTTALSSIAAATLNSATYGAAGAAAAATLASAGGSLTVTPASLQLTTTTAGQCFNEKLSLGTPVALTTDLVHLTLDQVFTTAGTSATTLQICGVLAHYTNTPL